MDSSRYPFPLLQRWVSHDQGTFGGLQDICKILSRTSREPRGQDRNRSNPVCQIRRVKAVRFYRVRFVRIFDQSLACAITGDCGGHTFFVLGHFDLSCSQDSTFLTLHCHLTGLGRCQNFAHSVGCVVTQRAWCWRCGFCNAALEPSRAGFGSNLETQCAGRGCTNES
jgi:hypothetical protein